MGCSGRPACRGRSSRASTGSVNKIIAAPELKDQLARQGIDPAGGTAEAFDKLFRAEVVTLGKVIKASGAKPE